MPRSIHVGRLIAQLWVALEQGANLARGHLGVHLGFLGGDQLQARRHRGQLGARNRHHAVAVAEDQIARLYRDLAHG